MSKTLLEKLEEYVETIGDGLDLIATMEINCCDAREIEVLESVSIYLQRLIVEEKDDKDEI